VDLGSGSVVTNMPNLAEMNNQSREIADVLRSLYLAYRADDASTQTQPVAKVHFSVDGAVRTFGVNTDKTRMKVPILDKKITVLRGDIRPVKTDDAANESFRVNCLPFRELATALGNANLKTVADEGHEWYMIPVAGRYELFLGGIECVLESVNVIDSAQGTNDVATGVRARCPVR
jgi:hypothetical protein